MTKFFIGDTVLLGKKRGIIQSLTGRDVKIVFFDGSTVWRYCNEIVLVKSDYSVVFTHKNNKNLKIYKYDGSELCSQAIKKLKVLKTINDNSSSLIRDAIKSLRIQLKTEDKYIFNNTYYNTLAEAKRALNKTIKDERAKRKSDVIDIYYKGGYKIRTINGFWDKNELYFIVNRKKIVKFYETKKPTTSDKHVGVEIEFLSKVNKDILAVKMLEKNKLWLADYVNFGSDGSIKTNNKYPYGIEARILATEDKIHYVIQELSDVLGDDVTVNSSCGLHVHLDMRTRDVIKSFWNLVTCQKLLFEMQPQSRRKNKYCSKTIGKDFNKLLNTRYKAINKQSWLDKRTLEVRLHSGTTNYEKINNFITLLTKIVDADKIKRVPRTRNKLFALLGLSSELREYIETRIRLFNNSILNENEVSTTLSNAA